MHKLFLPYDIYERHKFVGKQISNGDTVLDVGGELNHLNKFCTPKKIVVANLNTGDVIIKKDKLPFKKNSFNVVCAIDVLEHIPAKKRGEFVQKLLDISTNKIVLSFPIFTPNHQEYESDLLGWLRKKGEKVQYLEEHARYGLPTISQIKDITKAKKNKIYYSGNISLNRLVFKFYMFDPKIKGLRKVNYYFKLAINFLTDELLYILLTNKIFSENVNRAYVTIYKK